MYYLPVPSEEKLEMRTHLHVLRMVVFAMFCGVATNAIAADQVVPDKLLDQIRSWTASPVVLLSLEASNKRHDGLTEENILTLDKQWRAERKIDDQPLITAVLASPLSSYLTAIQAASLGLYTEIFVMDNKGLNAGQSAITSDYWQGDEAKFQKTFPMGPTAVFIDKPEIGDATGTENVQVNMSITNGVEAVGTVTVEVNLTELRRRQTAGKI
tara:strand:- start:183 stop:821 length:639 start_codon:yes stop_codon:yes gene_type:complete